MPSSNSHRKDFLGSRPYSRARVRDLLADWANVPANYFEGISQNTRPEPAVIRRVDSAIKRLMAHYPEIFSVVGVPEGHRPPDAESEITTQQWELAAEIQAYLRRAWEASDLRSREWFIFKARDKYHWQTVVMPLVHERFSAASDIEAEVSRYSEEEEAARHGPPRLTDFERAMYLFQRIADQARRCPNPDCPAPFFFAKRKNQRYCTEKCAAIGQREQKRDWWRQNRGK